MRSQAITTLGPGDLCLAAMADDELASERWLRMASRDDLVIAGICPDCRGDGCDRCADTGEVVQCESCGAPICPGQEQTVPVVVDQPNGPKTTICQTCAEIVDDSSDSPPENRQPATSRD